jgi:PAS domain S-box-containing protein
LNGTRDLPQAERSASSDQAPTEESRAQRHLRGQYEVARALAESPTLGEATPRILRAVCEVLGWEFGAMWAVRERLETLECVGTWRAPWVSAEEFEQETRTLAFGPGHGLPGSVWKTGQPIWAEDFSVHTTIQRAVQARSAGLHAAFCVPVSLGPKVLGVLEFFSSQVRPPDEELLAMMTALGRQIGQFIERKDAERELRENVARSIAMLRSSLDCVIGMDQDGRITEFNPAAERTFGHRRVDVLGKSLAETIVPRRLRDRHRAGLARYLETGEGRVIGNRIELTALRSDGSEFPVEVAISRVDAPGPPLFTGYLRDITNRKRREEERAHLLAAERGARADAEAGRERLSFLAEASAFLAGALDYTATLTRLADLAVTRIADWCVIDMVEEDGVLRPMALAHRDPQKLRWARDLEERYPPDPDAPRGPANVVRTGLPELNAEITDELLRAVARDEEMLRILRELGMTSAMSVPLSARGRTLGVMTFVSTAADRHYGPADLALAEELAGNAALAVDNARLFTEAERLNEELEARVADRTAELEASNRELEAFSYSVSHDLRAPLRAIDGFSRILIKDYGERMEEQAREYLGIVREGAQQMGRLIDDLLAFSRLGRQAIAKREVDPGELVRRVLDQLAPEMDGREVDVRVLELPTCQADPALLQQVYANLLENALKFTRTRSPAVVEVGSEGRPDGQVVYFVKDNGVGFDIRYADRLFGVFQRMHRAEDYEGTGVGLAIVQRVIHRHGGDVWAEAEPDVGATFLFTLDGEGSDG